jgi:hypothetical protein
MGPARAAREELRSASPERRRSALPKRRMGPVRRGRPRTGRRLPSTSADGTAGTTRDLSGRHVCAQLPVELYAPILRPPPADRSVQRSPSWCTTTETRSGSCWHGLPDEARDDRGYPTSTPIKNMVPAVRLPTWKAKHISHRPVAVDPLRQMRIFTPTR